MPALDCLQGRENQAGWAGSAFRLGHKMDLLELAEEDVDQGVMVKVRKEGQISYVPLVGWRREIHFPDQSHQ